MMRAKRFPSSNNKNNNKKRVFNDPRRIEMNPQAKYSNTAFSPSFIKSLLGSVVPSKSAAKRMASGARNLYIQVDTHQKGWCVYCDNQYTHIEILCESVNTSMSGVISFDSLETYKSQILPNEHPFPSMVPAFITHQSDKPQPMTLEHRNALLALRPFVSEEETRFSLGGINFKNGKVWQATNGHIACQVTTSQELFALPTSVLLPKDFVDVLLRLWEPTQYAKCELHVVDRWVVANLEGNLEGNESVPTYRVSAKLLDGTFPTMEQIFLSSKDKILELNLEGFSKGLKAFGKIDAGKGVKMSKGSDNESLLFSYRKNHKEKDRKEDRLSEGFEHRQTIEFPCKWEKDPNEIRYFESGYNLEYLKTSMDAIQSIGHKGNFAISWQNSLSPIQFEGKSEKSEIICVIMPMRL